MYGYGPTIVQIQEYAAAADRDVISMISGRPDWEPPGELRAGLREAADFDPAGFQYAPVEGFEALREALAAHHPGEVDPASVVVTAGTVEANYLAMARAFEREAGDVALVTDPAYPYYDARVRMLGGRVRRVPVEPDGQLDPDRLRERADDDVALVVINSPNNPTSAVWPAPTVRAAVRVAEDHDALLVSDEVYARFDRSGEFASALSVDSPARIVTGSVSKSMAATGLRVGYAVVPDVHREAAVMRHVLTTIAASRPAQHAALRALEGTDDDYYRRASERLGDRADRLVATLSAAGGDYVDPRGGMYVFARLPGRPGTRETIHELIDEAGVAAMPGDTFGDAYGDWIRFALTTPRIDEVAERLGAFLADRSGR